MGRQDGQAQDKDVDDRQIQACRLGPGGHLMVDGRMRCILRAMMMVAFVPFVVMQLMHLEGEVKRGSEGEQKQEESTGPGDPGGALHASQCSGQVGGRQEEMSIHPADPALPRRIRGSGKPWGHPS